MSLKWSLTACHPTVPKKTSQASHARLGNVWWRGAGLDRLGSAHQRLFGVAACMEVFNMPWRRGEEMKYDKSLLHPCGVFSISSPCFCSFFSSNNHASAEKWYLQDLSLPLYLGDLPLRDLLLGGRAGSKGKLWVPLGECPVAVCSLNLPLHVLYNPICSRYMVVQI